MQVDPVKLNLKPPGSELLKLKCDDPLSPFAFSFNLRRYNEVYNEQIYDLLTSANPIGGRACQILPDTSSNASGSRVNNLQWRIL